MEIPDVSLLAVFSVDSDDIDEASEWSTVRLHRRGSDAISLMVIRVAKWSS